jgi:hypothetical protein
VSPRRFRTMRSISTKRGMRRSASRRSPLRDACSGNRSLAVLRRADPRAVVQLCRGGRPLAEAIRAARCQRQHRAGWIA